MGQPAYWYVALTAMEPSMCGIENGETNGMAQINMLMAQFVMLIPHYSEQG